MKRSDLLSTCAPFVALLLGLLFAQSALAQDLQTPPTPPPSAVDLPTATDDQVAFSAGTLQYDTDSQIVTATGDVRMARSGDKLRADKVVWNRQTGKVLATGSVAVTNPGGDIAYGDSIDLTDSLKDGMVDNMLVVLERGGRLAARKGTRFPDEKVELEDAAYTPCNVTTSKGCPKEPSWKITAVRVTYRPDRQRIYYKGAQINVFGLPTIPLPAFSHPVGGGSDSGLLSPDLRYSRTNGFEYAQPYYFRLAPNRGLTITPRVFTGALPLLKAQYTALDTKGAFSITGYGTYSRRSDDLDTFEPTDTSVAFRGYIDGIARYQFDPNWSASASIRVASDRTFLRRYDISYDDRLRSTARIEHIDANSYFGITGWAVQTVRVNDSQGQQPIAFPEIDYRRRMDDGLLGGKFTFQANTLALTRTDGQDTQRGFLSARWDLRKLTRWGQEVTFTAFGRGDFYHTSDTLATSVLNYRGEEGVQSRVMGAVAVDVKWPLIGQFLGGTQRITPRVQIVASPHIKNLEIPNEDSRAVDLEDSNLFALNRFPGYDRIDDGTRLTYGADYALDLPGVAISTNIGQSYRLGTRSDIFPPGTGLDGRFSDFVGRTEVRYRDFVSLTHRYRLDKNGLAIRRNELDATIGSRATYILLGYLKLNRNITTTEDLQDREEVRIAGRVQFARFWSLYGSSLVDLTNRDEDPLSVSDGFTPVRHRLGVAYEDDCLKIGFTWKHDYQSTGDARAGNGFLLSLSFKNLGR
ncbi:LPS-assembly protein LptD [Sphingomonas sp. GB1N7]|uniref:LPS-assembly protein LptD n=1 Tax=Parasphingomonas caseinilytica TaxID=3096158 RepID=UPI002FCB3871